MLTARGIKQITDARDVDFPKTAANNSMALVYNHSTGEFEPGASGGGGSSTIAGSTDFTDTTGAGTDGYSVVWDNATSKFILSSVSGGGGGGSPGGSNTQVQYNNSGSFAGHSGFVYDGNGTATLSTALITPATRPSSDGTAAWKVTNSLGTEDIISADTTNGRVSIPHRLTITEGTADSGIYLARSTGSVGRILSFNGGNDLEIRGIGGGSIKFIANGATRLTLDGGTNVSFQQKLNASSGFVKFPTYQSALSVESSNRWNIFAPYTNEDMAFVSRGGHTFVVNGSAGGATHFDSVRFAPNGRMGVGQMSPTAFVDISGSTTNETSLRVRSGTAPTSPNDGDIWNDGTDLHIRIGSTTYTLDKTSV